VDKVLNYWYNVYPDNQKNSQYVSFPTTLGLGAKFGILRD